jgi:hypothetical protein
MRSIECPAFRNILFALSLFPTRDGADYKGNDDSYKEYFIVELGCCAASWMAKGCSAALRQEM